MAKERFKLINPNNKFKDMNIGIMESDGRVLKLSDVVVLLNALYDENEQLKQYKQAVSDVLLSWSQKKLSAKELQVVIAIMEELGG